MYGNVILLYIGKHTGILNASQLKITWGETRIMCLRLRLTRDSGVFFFSCAVR